MNRNTRIELTDTPMDVIVKMSEGNPGAMTVLINLFKEGGEIDPDAAFGGLASVLDLDSHGIYGSRIWCLFKDVCGQDLTATVGVLRGCQLGLLPEADLLRAIDNYGQGIDVEDILEQVRERLPNFGGQQNQFRR
jgi:hypothetical protein